MSFFVTKTVLVGPKWFWSDQIDDLDLTIMIWSWPKWYGHDQNELVRSKLWFSTKMNHNLDLTNPFWSWLFHYGYDQIIMVKSKSFGQTKTILDRPELFWSHRRTRHYYNAASENCRTPQMSQFLLLCYDILKVHTTTIISNIT